MKPRKGRANKRWIMKRITPVGHRSWGPLETAQNMHPWVILSGVQGAEVFILVYQFLSVGNPEFLVGRGHAPEPLNLRVTYRCCREEAGPACTEWWRGRAVSGTPEHQLQAPAGRCLNKTFSRLDEDELLGKITFVHLPRCPSTCDLATHLRTCLSSGCL